MTYEIILWKSNNHEYLKKDVKFETKTDRNVSLIHKTIQDEGEYSNSCVSCWMYNMRFSNYTRPFADKFVVPENEIWKSR